MVKRKPLTYIVTVTATDYSKYEEEVFEMEYEADDDETEKEACARALSIAADGCSDED